MYGELGRGNTAVTSIPTLFHDENPSGGFRIFPARFGAAPKPGPAKSAAWRKISIQWVDTSER